MFALPDGVYHWPGFFDQSAQETLLHLIREATQAAPLFVPKMPRTGKPMSVRMTNMGSLGWVTDKQNGYRYQDTHPETGKSWPEIPQPLRDLWQEKAGYNQPAEACLVNFYTNEAKMGLHQDRNEVDFDAPVLSVSLGNACLFRVGGVKRGGKTTSFRLESGDVMMLSGPARLAYHGVDKIYPETSDLLKDGGRINLTLRRVTKIESPN